MSLIVWIVWEGSRSLLDDPTWEPRETKKKKRWRSHSPSLVAPPQPPPPPPPDDISQTRTKSLSLFLFSEKLWGFIVDYVYSCIVKSSTSSQPASFHIERSLLYTHTEFSLVSGQDWNDVVRLPFLLLPLNLHHEHSRWLYSRHIQGPQLESWKQSGIPSLSLVSPLFHHLSVLWWDSIQLVRVIISIRNRSGALHNMRYTTIPCMFTVIYVCVCV